MKRVIICLLLVFLSPSLSFAQAKVCVIKGVVSDQKRERVPYANVFFKDGKLEGELTDEKGEFEIKTTICGKRKLMVSRLGYEKEVLNIELLPDRPVALEIILKEEPVELKGITVTASSFSSKEEDAGIAINRMDVVTTPGAAADVFQSIKALPGLTPVSEGAELFVRGGNPYETVTLLDQASLTHPYHNESHYGGLFGVIDPSVIKDIYFSSGGFSAKYGNALSGVLDIKTEDWVEKSEMDVNVNIAGFGINSAFPLYNNKFALRFSGRKSINDLLFQVNRIQADFISVPTSEDGTFNLSWRYSSKGKLRLFVLGGDDQQSLMVDLPSYSQELGNRSKSILYNLQITDILPRNILTKISLSSSRYLKAWRYGVWKFENKESLEKLRWDNELLYGNENLFNFGLEMSKEGFLFRGIFPEDSADFSPDAPQKVIEDQNEVICLGGYTENEIHLSEKLFLKAGIRCDYQSLSRFFTFDKRFSVGFSISPRDVIRLSWGTFHQHPSLEYLDRKYGNPQLKASKAYHAVIGWEREWYKNALRIETYYKKYQKLPLDQDQLNYSNQGYGYAGGIDLIFKANLTSKISGWLTYSFIQTKRKELNFPKLLPTAYDIPHNLNLVGKVGLGTSYQVGINYRFSTGPLFTPIVESYYDSAQAVWRPIYGAINSERFPNYNRLDVRFTKIFSIHPEVFSFCYLEILNILNIPNIMDYSYSSDYSKRERILSFFSKRCAVFGVGMNF